MFIFDASITAAAQAEEIRKQEQAEEVRKQQEEERKAEEKKQEEIKIANEKKAKELEKQKEATRAKSTAKPKGISGLSNKTQAASIQKRRETSSEGAREQISKSSGDESGKIARNSLKNEISNLDKDIANLDPNDPNYANDKAILEREKSQLKQEVNQSAKFDFNEKQIETNRKLKQEFGGTKYYGFDADKPLKPDLQAMVDRNMAEKRSNGDPTNLGGRMRRLAALDKQKGLSGKGSENQLAGGDIDFKNAKGAVRNIAGKTFYAPDKNKDDVYEVKLEKNTYHVEDSRHEKLRDKNHNLLKQMYEGTLDEAGMKESGVAFNKTSYDKELAQHKERKKNGVLTAEQTERKKEAVASARDRRETLQGMLSSVPPLQAAKIQRKIDKIDGLIARQEAALTNSSDALASAKPEQLDKMGIDKEGKSVVKADSDKAAELREEKELAKAEEKEEAKAEEEKEEEQDQAAVSSLKGELAASKDSAKIRSVKSKIDNLEVADASTSVKSSLQSSASSALTEAQAEEAKKKSQKELDLSREVAIKQKLPESGNDSDTKNLAYADSETLKIGKTDAVAELPPYILDAANKANKTA